MQTKFKKGDLVRAVKDDYMGRFKEGQTGIVYDVDLYDIPAITWDNGSQSSAQHECILILHSHRPASEITLRERLYAAKEIYIELIQMGKPANMDTAKTAAKAVHALIQALNEKP